MKMSSGSIGVVMFKPNFAGLLDRFGVSEDSLSRGRYSRLMDTTKGLDEQERTLIRTQMGGIYDMFLNRVAEGRGMKAADVDKIGGGRVWTGAQAVDLHLADEIGGFKQAVAKAAEAASIPDASSVELVFYPREGHGLREYYHQLDRLERQFAWITSHTSGDQKKSPQ